VPSLSLHNSTIDHRACVLLEDILGCAKSRKWEFQSDGGRPNAISHEAIWGGRWSQGGKKKSLASRRWNACLRLGQRFLNCGNKNLNFIENVEGPTQRAAHATAHPVCHVRDSAEDYIKLWNYYNYANRISFPPNIGKDANANVNEIRSIGRR
jgi:hypothetical protein